MRIFSSAVLSVGTTAVWCLLVGLIGLNGGGFWPTLQAASLDSTPAHGSSESQYKAAVQHAVALLPERPTQVLIIDADDARPQDRTNLLRLQAFILKGSPVIYLTRHGNVLQLASRGSRFHEYMLATVIWHEMAHVSGADETEARRREEALWQRFILENAVDRDAAMSYLAALRKRPPLLAEIGIAGVRRSEDDPIQRDTWDSGTRR